MLRAAARLEKKRTGGHQTVVFWFVRLGVVARHVPPPAQPLLFSARSAALRRAPRRPPRAPRRTLLRARVVVLDAHAVLARGTGMLARVLSR